MEQPPSALANVTSFLPSPADLLLAVPRLLSRAGTFAEHLDSVFGKMRSGGSVIAEPTASNVTNATIATTSAMFVQESVAAAATAATTAPEDITMFQALKNVGSFFSYITSKWAIATFTTAILLNRTHFYASSRVPLSFDRLHLRIVLYILPTLLFVYRIQSVLQAIRCQSSPGWSEMQYGAANRQLDTDFGGEGGLLWRVSSSLLFWEDTEASCKAINMLPSNPSSTRPAGSLALLWPLFLSLGLSQFIETLSCALQGRQPLQEVGMTIFEHSLAFAEAEAVVTKPLTMDSVRFWRPKLVFTPDGTSLSIPRSTLSQFANVPPEVLLIALISSLSHLTSNCLAIIGLRARYRLITTGIWGVAYMSAFAWSFIRFAATISEPGPQVGILRFPTVCIVGFIPHLLILTGIAACGLIYLIALALTVLNPPPGQPENMTWRERLNVAYSNLHANIHLSAITPLTINWHEDFYTAILKLGFTVLTAASEAVYLNEGTRVNVNSMTWLEKKRLQELIARRRRFRQNLATIPRELQGTSFADGVEVVDKVHEDPTKHLSDSGYARERKTRMSTTKTAEASRAVGRDTGVGLHQRRGRWALTYQFLVGISRLLITIQAKITITIFRKLRIPYQPQWLYRLAGPQTVEKPRVATPVSSSAHTATSPESWLALDEETLQRPAVNFDVEDLARNRIRRSGMNEEQDAQGSEETLTEYLYNWWKIGGKWGDVDTSGDYVPPPDDDATSVISQSTTAEDEWSDFSEGQRTPTQSWSFSRSRESTPSYDDSIDMSRLSALLDPRTKEDREEARVLSRHLQSPGTMTRSQFRKVIEREEARILTTSRLPLGFKDGTHLLPEEEERVLEEFILNKRGATIGAQSTNSAGTWNTGAEGMGSEGPQCVVCQLSPRTVLVWPCGCLSLCDECRVGLASKNYTTCVCCRTNVVAYSKLYVP